MRGAALLAALALAACETAVVAPPPEPAPAVPRPATRVAPPQPSAASRDLVLYYKRVEASLLGQGLLRTDGGGPDAPFEARQLVQNFVKIALFEEYTAVGGRIVAEETASRLHRWSDPVRLEVSFGPSVPPEQRQRDHRSIAAYVERIRRITGHPLTTVRSDGNFHVFIVNEDERRALGPRLRALVPGISNAAVLAVSEMPRTSYCLVFALDPADSGSYRQAVAVIRQEHPDLLRLSCLHEEIAQGMGLSNDSPDARPSIFNDDEEFALLTTHDEMLLRILYDPRLRPGMTEADARPIVATIANEMMTGG